MRRRSLAWWTLSVLAFAAVATGVGTAPGAASAQTSGGGSTLFAGESLRPTTVGGAGGNALQSPNGGYEVVIGYDASTPTAGYVELEIDELDPTVVGGLWLQSGAATPATLLQLQTDGNLVLYGRPGVAVWSSHTAGTGSHNRLVMQDDGNLVLYTAANKAVWASHTAKEMLVPGERLAAGQRLTNVYSHTEAPTVLTMQRDGDLVVTQGARTVWASNTLIPGSYLQLLDNGNLVIVGHGTIQWTSRTGGTAGTDGVHPFLDVQGLADFGVLTTPPDSTGGGIKTVYDSLGARGELGRTRQTDPLRLMTPRSVLAAGRSLSSDNGYRLTMQPDGNLVQRGPRGTFRWMSHTARHPGAYLTLLTNGNIAIFYRGHALWSTRTTQSLTFVMQPDGNEVARDVHGRPTWASHTRV